MYLLFTSSSDQTIWGLWCQPWNFFTIRFLSRTLINYCWLDSSFSEVSVDVVANRLPRQWFVRLWAPFGRITILIVSTSNCCILHRFQIFVIVTVTHHPFGIGMSTVKFNIVLVSREHPPPMGWKIRLDSLSLFSLLSQIQSPKVGRKATDFMATDECHGTGNGTGNGAEMVMKASPRTRKRRVSLYAQSLKT